MKLKVFDIVTLKRTMVTSLPSYTTGLIRGRAVANIQVLVQPVLAPEETIPTKLTFTILSCKRTKDYSILVFIMLFNEEMRGKHRVQ